MDKKSGITVALKKQEQTGIIENDIRHQIETGILQTEDCLPSENKLAKLYNARLSEVRKATKKLVEQGYLYTKPKSGIFVADIQIPEPVNSPPANPEGVNLFEIIGIAKCDLKFLIANWHKSDRSIWEDIVKKFNQSSNRLKVNPVFINSIADYHTVLENSDIATTTIFSMFCPYSNFDKFELFSIDETRNWPLNEKYMECLTHNKKIIGVPTKGALLTATIDRKHKEFFQHVSSMNTWDDIFAETSEYKKYFPDKEGISFFPTYSMNYFHYLTITVDELIHQETNSIAINRKSVSDYLNLINRYRNKIYSLPENKTIESAKMNHEYLIDFSFTFKNGINPGFIKDRQPWLYPAGKNGGYPEVLGVGCVLKNSPYIEEGKKFLHYLLSDEIQSMVLQSPCEHPVSTQVKTPFQAYPKEWRDILSKMKKNSILFREFFPGYCVFLDTIFMPLMEKVYHGELNVEKALSQCQKKSELLMNRFQNP